MLFATLCFGQTVNAQNLSVTINNKNTQSNITSLPVVFSVLFSQPINVASFTAANIAFSGTATGDSVILIKQVAPNNGTSFEVTVTASSNNGTIIATIPAAGYSSVILSATGPHPRGIVTDALGNIYVANITANNITKITPAGISTIYGTTNYYPQKIIFDALGNLYAANYGSSNVTKITPAGLSSTFGSTGTHPSAMAIDTSGNLYIANMYDNNVTKITKTGASTIFALTGATPKDIIIDSAGNLYTANADSNTVTKITPAGIATTLAKTGNSPQSITIDRAGNLYTGNFYSYDISKLTPDGKSSIIASNIYCPNGITIDSSGNLYTCNCDNTVTKILPSGAAAVIATIGQGPHAMTIDAEGNLYTTNEIAENVSKIFPSGIALAGSSKPVNAASTSTDNSFTLPVKLVYFTATNTNCIATLNWATSFEFNNKYYGIEYSNDAINFIEAATIEGKNNLTGSTYSYTIKKQLSGIIYYRLKIADIDGKFQYSNIVVLSKNAACEAAIQQPSISPNPATEFVVVSGLIKSAQLSLINSTGSILNSMLATGSSQRIDISTYPKGVYILRIVSADGEIKTLKIIKE